MKKINNGKILCVGPSDDANFAKLLRELQREGYYVGCSKSIDIDRVKSEFPRCILFDYDWNTQKCKSWIHQLNQDLIARTIPIVGVSKKASDKELQALGCDWHVHSISTFKEVKNTLEDIANTKELILIIDDDQDIVEMVSLGLSPHFRVLTASDGTTGYKLYLENKVHLLLLDLAMKGLSGIELLEKLRSQDIRTPVITISGGGEELSATLLTGADAIIEKPFSMDQVRDSCRRLLTLRYDKALSGIEIEAAPRAPKE